MKKLLLLVGATLTMAACSEAPTAPNANRLAPAGKASFDITCRSGYVVAYDEDGNPYCKLDDTRQETSSSTPSATGPTATSPTVARP